MRDYKLEFENRVNFVKNLLKESKADGIVFGNSGGKDSALVGIICKAACQNTVGVILPCSAKRNFTQDASDGEELAKAYNIESRIVDVTPVKEALLKSLQGITKINKNADTNIAPRLRMATLYAIGAAENRLVAGTGNRSEMYVGYFTKWGDGGHDFNPISDLTVTEVYEFLRFLNAPKSIIEKAPSAGLYEGQTDEDDLGFTYAELDKHIMGEKINEQSLKKIERMHKISEHKREPIKRYKNIKE